MELLCYPTTAAMAAAAAREACAVLSAAIAARGAASAMFATGNSQLAFYEALAREPGVDWSRVTCFHIDEYCGITAEHSASFRRYLQARLEAVLQPRAVHYLCGEAEDADAECARYTALLAAHPLDLCCLGVGENGHLGFNDPPPLGGADFADPAVIKRVTLDEACRLQQVGEGHFATLDDVPRFALTATIPAMLAAKAVLCIVPERRKAAIVQRTLLDPVSTACPSTILRRAAHVKMYLDGESRALVVAE
jgi:glucosamine-6-phosphate deaminase